MKGKKIFALSVAALAVSHAVYAEVGMLPEVSVIPFPVKEAYNYDHL